MVKESGGAKATLVKKTSILKLCFVPLRLGRESRVTGKCIWVQQRPILWTVSSQLALTVAQANIWKYCGGILLKTVLIKWSGTYTLVQFAIPFTLAF
jgi:hypothetical protein